MTSKTDNILEVELVQVGRAIRASIVKQDERLRSKGDIVKSCVIDWGIFSFASPELGRRGLYLRGSSRRKDGVVYRIYNDSSLPPPRDVMERLHKMIKLLNKEGFAGKTIWCS